MELTRYESVAGEPLPEQRKVGILVAATTGKLHDHLVLNMNDLTTYVQVNYIVVNYMRPEKLKYNSRSQPGDAVPMDVGSVGAQGKGGGKTKKYCDICCREGHWASERRYRNYDQNYQRTGGKGNGCKGKTKSGKRLLQRQSD